MPSKIKKAPKKVSIASRIDQTNIDPKASLIDIKKTCAEVKKYGFARHLRQSAVGGGGQR